jgi:hypothetical protein
MLRPFAAGPPMRPVGSWISPKGRLVDYKRDAWTIPMDDAKRLAAEWAKKCGGWCFEVIAETRA